MSGGPIHVPVQGHPPPPHPMAMPHPPRSWPRHIARGGGGGGHGAAVVGRRGITRGPYHSAPHATAQGRRATWSMQPRGAGGCSTPAGPFLRRPPPPLPPGHRPLRPSQAAPNGTWGPRPPPTPPEAEAVQGPPHPKGWQGRPVGPGEGLPLTSAAAHRPGGWTMPCGQGCIRRGGGGGHPPQGRTRWAEVAFWIPPPRAGECPRQCGCPQ